MKRIAVSGIVFVFIVIMVFTGLAFHVGVADGQGLLGGLNNRPEDGSAPSGTKPSNQVKKPDATSILGFVVDHKNDGIDDADVRLTVQGKPYSAKTSAGGVFLITLDNGVIFPDEFVIMAKKKGFSTGSMILRSYRTQDVTIKLRATSSAVVDIERKVHHLGDGSATGSINSQFQMPGAEKKSFEKKFTLRPEHLPPLNISAKLSLMVKGAQRNNLVIINEKTIGVLNGSPSNGSMSVMNIDFDISLLKPGENTIGLRSARAGADYDDFEFANIQIRFESSEDLEATDDNLVRLTAFFATDLNLSGEIKTVPIGGAFRVKGKGNSGSKQFRDLAKVEIYPEKTGVSDAILVDLLETGANTSQYVSSWPISVDSFDINPGDNLIIKQGLRGFTLKVVKEQTIAARDISGLWKTTYEDGPSWITMIVQKNGKVDASAISGSEKWKERGYREGDRVMHGQIRNDLFSGKLNVHFSTDYKERCPNQWERWEDIGLKLNEKGDVLTGQWQKYRIDRDCRVYKDIPVSIRFERIRQMNPVPDSLAKNMSVKSDKDLENSITFDNKDLERINNEIQDVRDTIKEKKRNPNDKSLPSLEKLREKLDDLVLERDYLLESLDAGTKEKIKRAGRKTDATPTDNRVASSPGDRKEPFDGTETDSTDSSTGTIAENQDDSHTVVEDDKDGKVVSAESDLPENQSTDDGVASGQDETSTHKDTETNSTDSSTGTIAENEDDSRTVVEDDKDGKVVSAESNLPENQSTDDSVAQGQDETSTHKETESSSIETADTDENSLAEQGIIREDGELERLRALANLDLQDIDNNIKDAIKRGDNKEAYRLRIELDELEEETFSLFEPTEKELGEGPKHELDLAEFYRAEDERIRRAVTADAGYSNLNDKRNEVVENRAKRAEVYNEKIKDLDIEIAEQEAIIKQDDNRLAAVFDTDPDRFRRDMLKIDARKKLKELEAERNELVEIKNLHVQRSIEEIKGYDNELKQRADDIERASWETNPDARDAEVASRLVEMGSKRKALAQIRQARDESKKIFESESKQAASSLAMAEELGNSNDVDRYEKKLEQLERNYHDSDDYYQHREVNAVKALDLMQVHNYKDGLGSSMTPETTGDTVYSELLDKTIVQNREKTNLAHENLININAEYGADSDESKALREEIRERQLRSQVLEQQQSEHANGYNLSDDHRERIKRSARVRADSESTPDKSSERIIAESLRDEFIHNLNPAVVVKKNVYFVKGAAEGAVDIGVGVYEMSNTLGQAKREVVASFAEIGAEALTGSGGDLHSVFGTEVADSIYNTYTVLDDLGVEGTALMIGDKFADELKRLQRSNDYDKTSAEIGGKVAINVATFADYGPMITALRAGELASLARGEKIIANVGRIVTTEKNLASTVEKGKLLFGKGKGGAAPVIKGKLLESGGAVTRDFVPIEGVAGNVPKGRLLEAGGKQGKVAESPKLAVKGEAAKNPSVKKPSEMTRVERQKHSDALQQEQFERKWRKGVPPEDGGPDILPSPTGGPTDLPVGALTRELTPRQIEELYKTGANVTPEQIQQKVELLIRTNRLKRVRNLQGNPTGSKAPSSLNDSSAGTVIVNEGKIASGTGGAKVAERGGSGGKGGNTHILDRRSLPSEGAGTGGGGSGRSQLSQGEPGGKGNTHILDRRSLPNEGSGTGGGSGRSQLSQDVPGGKGGSQAAERGEFKTELLIPDKTSVTSLDPYKTVPPPKNASGGKGSKLQAAERGEFKTELLIPDKTSVTSLDPYKTVPPPKSASGGKGGSQVAERGGFKTELLIPDKTSVTNLDPYKTVPPPKNASGGKGGNRSGSRADTEVYQMSQEQRGRLMAEAAERKLAANPSTEALRPNRPSMSELGGRPIGERHVQRLDRSILNERLNSEPKTKTSGRDPFETVPPPGYPRRTQRLSDADLPETITSTPKAEAPSPDGKGSIRALVERYSRNNPQPPAGERKLVDGMEEMLRITTPKGRKKFDLAKKLIDDAIKNDPRLKNVNREDLLRNVAMRADSKKPAAELVERAIRDNTPGPNIEPAMLSETPMGIKDATTVEPRPDIDVPKSRLGQKNKPTIEVPSSSMRQRTNPSEAIEPTKGKPKTPKSPQDKTNRTVHNEPKLLDNNGKPISDAKLRQLQREGKKLSKGLDKYYRYGEKVMDSMHVTSTENLAKIIKDGHMTTEGVTFSNEGRGAVRLGGEAIRIRLGSKKYVHMGDGGAYGVAPKYYKDGIKYLPDGKTVDLSKGNTYIPLRHLQHFDKKIGRWMNFKVK